MATAQSIFLFAQKCSHHAAEEDDIWQAIEATARKIAKSFPWQWLRRNIAFSQEEDASQGMLMPANMVNVIGPIVDSDEYVYEHLDISLTTIPPNSTGRYYFFDTGAMTPIADADGVSINKGSKTLTFSPALDGGDYTGDYDGEFIRLTDADDRDMGIFEMASASALENYYWGDRIKNGHYMIRPSTCRRLSLCNGDGDRVEATATVQYWVYPSPLVAAHLEFPDYWEEPLRAGVWIELMTDTVDKHSVRIRAARQKDYDVALGFAQMADGKPPMNNINRDLTGNVRRMGWR